jgi:hypothetical protein
MRDADRLRIGPAAPESAGARKVAYVLNPYPGPLRSGTLLGGVVRRNCPPEPRRGTTCSTMADNANSLAR